ncbi:MAG: T9SS type A sorting domain-containing protein [candidate division WOR-3 bacterium]|nr:MAG: T9SS type A sorting domain-containing protein [candidate division WOR-3 bacterium]
MKAIFLSLLLAATVDSSICLAQNYRCDWYVVGSGGGSLTSTNYRVGVTAGQTAAGPMSGTEFLALLGFWQADYGVGIKERQDGVSPGRLVTELRAPAPNPFSRSTRIRYSLANASRVRLLAYDLSGRRVTTLADIDMEPGHHELVWHGNSGRRQMPAGVYFIRLQAGETDMVERVLIAR